MTRHGNEGKRHHRISHGAAVLSVGDGGAKEWGMMDAHPQLLQERRNFFVKLRQPPVSAGEEILVDYRYSERQQTLWGFGPLANRPKLQSEYGENGKVRKDADCTKMKRTTEIFLF